jgi:hypothetical protein
MEHSIPNHSDRTLMEEENRESKPAPPPKPKADAIALLFLTVGEIRNSEIWAAWLKPVNPDLYSIYVHAKVKYHVDIFLSLIHPCPDSSGQNPEQVVHPRFAKYRIKPVKTKWGDISLVEAHLELLKSAVKNKSNRSGKNPARLFRHAYAVVNHIPLECGYYYVS